MIQRSERIIIEIRHASYVRYISHRLAAKIVFKTLILISYFIQDPDNIEDNKINFANIYSMEF